MPGYSRLTDLQEMDTKANKPKKNKEEAEEEPIHMALVPI